MTARLTASPFFQSFDGPDRNASTPVRDSSVTTVQALFFLNDKALHEYSSNFADRILKEAPQEPARIDRAFGLIFQRSPTPEERSKVATHLSSARERLSDNKVSAEEQEPLVWASLARAMLRSNEFLYLD
jgi:hypothetical protein